MILDVDMAYINARRSGPWQEYIFSCHGEVVEMLQEAAYTIWRERVSGRYYIDLAGWNAARVLLTAETGNPFLDEPTEEFVKWLQRSYLDFKFAELDE